METNKQITKAKDISEVNEPELPQTKEQEAEEQTEARESFMIELPNGYKLASQSCSLRVDQLADLILNVYHIIKNENETENKKPSYSG
jgi:hypothetical protein